MNKNLYNLLGSFSADEWNKFDDFVSNRYFAKSRDYKEIMSVLRKYILKSKKTEELTEECFFVEMKEKISRHTLTNRLSEINKLAEKFLVIDSIDDKTVSFRSNLYGKLLGRNLFSNFNYIHNPVKEKLVPNDTEDYPDYCKVLVSEAHYHRINGEIPVVLQKYLEHSEYYAAYFLNKSILLAMDFHFMKLHGFIGEYEVYNKYFDILNIDEQMQSIIAKDSPVFKPAVLMYYIYKYLLNASDKEMHRRVIEYFENNMRFFSMLIKTDYYMKMMSQYVHMHNTRAAKCIPDMFELMKSRIKDGETVDFSHQRYPATEFRDFVAIGLLNGETAWVENFIKKYSPQIPASIREDEYTNAMVSLYTQKKDLLNAFHVINKQKQSSNHIHNLDMYRMKIMINYDLDRTARNEDEIALLKKYFRKKGIDKKHREATNNFLVNYYKLIELKESGQSKGFSTLAEKYTKTLLPSADIQWLKAKVTGLLPV